MELNNRYSSSGSSFGVNAGAAIGYGHKMQTTGNGGSVSLGRGSQNTEETVYHNGSFANVNEVHNNTGTMTVSGFNQEGGKVTGNINNLIVESRQNISTTTGRSSGMNIGVSSQGIPNSVGISGSRTEGSRAYVDNQTAFIAGEGSSLTVGKADNTGAVISATGNGTIDIQSYTGKDIQNYDTMKTAGGSIGLAAGSVPLSNIGFNQETRDREGTARNTVTGNVTTTAGDTVNRDMSRANETTRDTYSRTNINVESQTIQYAANPDKLKEDLGKAKDEIEAIGAIVQAAIGSKEQNSFLDFLRTERIQETIRNIGYIDTKGKTRDEIAQEIVNKYGDIFEKNGEKLEVKFYVNSEISADDPKGNNKRNSAGFVAEDGSIWLNADNISSTDNFSLNSVVGHEGVHKVTGKNTELLANYGETRASKFIEDSISKGYISRIGGSIGWDKANLTEEEKARLSSYQDIEEKIKITNYLRKYNGTPNGIILIGKEDGLISKLENEIKKELGIKNFNISDNIESLDMNGKTQLASEVSSALQHELYDSLAEYRDAVGNEKKKIGKEIEKKYGILDKDLSTAVNNIIEYSIGETGKDILKKMNTEILENTVNSILNNSKLSNSQKVSEINKRLGVQITEKDLGNRSQTMSTIFEQTSLEKVVGQKTDRIANDVRQESQFFKNFLENSQKLTNRQIVIDENDFVWYVDKNGQVSSKAEGDLVYAKGRVAGDNYKVGNELMKKVIDNDKTIFVINNPGDAYVRPANANAYINADGSANTGSDSYLGIDFNLKAKYYTLTGTDKKTKLPIINDLPDGNTEIHMILGHEINHGKSNQEGINQRLVPGYHIYMDEKNNIHFSGESIKNMPINKNTTEESLRKEIIREIEDMKREVTVKKNATLNPGDRAGLELKEKEIQHMLGRLNDKNSDIYEFFMMNTKIKLDEARKNSSSTINLNYPVRADINQEEINTTRVEGELEREQGDTIRGIYGK